MTKWIIIALLLLLIGMLVLAFVVTQIENHQARKNKAYTSGRTAQSSGHSNTAIVVFSRSGNTGVLANHIAHKTSGRMYEITAEDYELGIPGWIRALKDARNHIATIQPATIDLRGYETVYLGSPIWLYSPAPPIWQFASNNDFTGKRVVLFNSFNSKFEQGFIDEFEALVRLNGATDFAHRYVNRGRMGDQISSAELTEAFDAQAQEF